MHCWGAMEFVPDAKVVRQDTFMHCSRYMKFK